MTIDMQELFQKIINYIIIKNYWMYSISKYHNRLVLFYK